jgi:hypothetical protein
MIKTKKLNRIIIFLKIILIQGMLAYGQTTSTVPSVVAGQSQGKVNYKYYSKADLEKDLTFIYEKFTSIHPIFLNKTFKEKWVIEFEAAKRLLKDSMTQNQFYLISAPLLAYLNDSHSNFLCPGDQRRKFMMEGGLSFPFSVSISDNSIFVTEYYGNDSLLFKGGEEIVQINGIPSSDILHEMQKLIGGKNILVKNLTIEMYFRSYLWMIYGFEKDYYLLLRDNTNQLSEIFVKGINNDQFLRNRKRYPPMMTEHYSLSFDRNIKTSVLTIRSFSDLDGFCAFADSAFQVIAKESIDNLIIDIRGNLGGRSIVVDSLMNYLTNKPYSQYKRIETLISNDLKVYYQAKYPEKYDAIKDFENGDLISSQGDMVIPLEKKYRFNGKLFLLTDSKTSSAAATFAGVFKEFKLGVIVGEETGGTIEYFGDFWFLTLPNTGLQFHISPKRFVQHGGTDLKRGVIPDFVISNSHGSIMDFTKKLINNK